MRKNSTLTDLLKIEIPLIQAPMAGNAGTPAFFAAAANAGALSSIGAGYMEPLALSEMIRKTRALTNQPLSVNFFVPQKAEATPTQLETARKAIEASCQELHIAIKPVQPPYVPSFDDQLNVVLEEKIPIVSFTFGIPSDEWISKLKKLGVILIGTATTLEEGQMLMTRGMDIIAAQGKEAGGHRGSFLKPVEDSLVSLSTLVKELVGSISIPVIAAGGIMDGADIRAIMALGAQGVQMGTAFLTCKESGIYQGYKDRLLNLKKDETVLTRAFSGKFARGIKNIFIERMKAHESTILAYPIQHAMTTEMRKVAAQQDNIEFMSMWAGQSAFRCKSISVAALIEELKAVFK